MKDDLIGYLASFSRPITGLKIGTDTQIRRYTDTQIDRGRTLWLFIVDKVLCLCF